MGHDASKVLLGNTLSSAKTADSKVGTTAAGLGVLASGEIFEGISLGPDLSKAGHIVVAKAGLKIPVRLKAAFTPVVDTQVYIDSGTLLACPSTDTDAVATAGIYKSAVITGIDPHNANAEHPCALIDMVGGL